MVRARQGESVGPIHRLLDATVVGPAVRSILRVQQVPFGDLSSEPKRGFDASDVVSESLLSDLRRAGVTLTESSAIGSS